MESELRRLIHAFFLPFGVAESLPIIFPNVDKYEKQTDNHLRFSVLPVRPELLVICDGGSLYQWILQIDVVVDSDDNELTATDIIDKLRAYCPCLTPFVGANHKYRVIRPASAAPPVRINGWFSIPVDFRISTIH